MLTLKVWLKRISISKQLRFDIPAMTSPHLLAVSSECTELIADPIGSDAPVDLNQLDQLRWIRASAVSPGAGYVLNLPSHC